LGRVLGVGQCSADDLYRALDWLHGAQPAIERRLTFPRKRDSSELESGRSDLGA
jgi:hypothetical protein